MSDGCDEKAAEARADFWHEQDLEKIEALTTERDRLRAIVDKLPKTMDGVPICAGMEIFTACPDGISRGIVKQSLWDEDVSFVVACFDDFGDDEASLGCLYSTREAAEVAMQEADSD